ncbi:MAG: tetratricopeptide repeat protein [Planctomycetaceae bacterium]|jgi:tetratricopeptide (TPR) repeat protein|nr:tetratricopeptide repeat protein [Planctomycetaceae bacterium]
MRYYGKIFIIGWILAIVLLQGCSQIQTVFQLKETSVKNSVSQADESLFEEAKRDSDNGDKSHAIEIYREYIKKHPKGNANALGVAHARLGMLLSEQKEYQESRDCFEKAMNYKPGDLEICGAYANSLFEQEDYRSAESLWRQGLQISPNDKRFQMMLGYTLAQEKKYQAGISYLKRAVGEQKAYEEMAAIYRSHEEYDRAIIALNKSQQSRSKERQMEQQASYVANQPVNRYQNAKEYTTANAAVFNNVNNLPFNHGVNVREISQPPYYNSHNNPPIYAAQQNRERPLIQSYAPQALTAQPQQIAPQSITQNGYYTYSQPSNYGNYDVPPTSNVAPQQQPLPNRQTEMPPTEPSPGVQPTGMPYGFAASQPNVNLPPPAPDQNANLPQYYVPQEIAQRPHYDRPPIQNYPNRNPSAPYYAAPMESVQQPVNPLARAYGYADVGANVGNGNAVSNANGRMMQTFNP